MTDSAPAPERLDVAKPRGLVWTLAFISYYWFARWLPVSHSYGPIGRVASRLRALLCRRLFDRCGSGVNVEHGAEFGSGRGVVLHDRAGVGVRAQLLGEGGVEIGRDVMMGPDVTILTQDHRMTPDGRYDGFDVGKVTIEDDAWIGARAVILRGVRIGHHSVVAAGAIVTKDVPPYAIVGSSAARVIKERPGSKPGAE
jgi:maltose O-acetyltransferase